jgi:hypothetical protein
MLIPHARKWGGAVQHHVLGQQPLLNTLNISADHHRRTGMEMLSMVFNVLRLLSFVTT